MFLYVLLFLCLCGSAFTDATVSFSTPPPDVLHGTNSVFKVTVGNLATSPTHLVFSNDNGQCDYYDAEDSALTGGSLQVTSDNNMYTVKINCGAPGLVTITAVMEGETTQFTSTFYNTGVTAASATSDVMKNVVGTLNVELIANPASTAPQFKFTPTLAGVCTFSYDNANLTENVYTPTVAELTDKKFSVTFVCDTVAGNQQIQVTPQGASTTYFAQVDSEPFNVSGFTLSTPADVIADASTTYVTVTLTPTPNSPITFDISVPEGLSCTYLDESLQNIEKLVVTTSEAKLFYTCHTRTAGGQNITLTTESPYNSIYGNETTTSFSVTGMAITVPEFVRKNDIAKLTLDFLPTPSVATNITLSSEDSSAEGVCKFFHDAEATTLIEDQIFLAPENQASVSLYFLCLHKTDITAIYAQPTIAESNYYAKVTSTHMTSGTDVTPVTKLKKATMSDEIVVSVEPAAPSDMTFHLTTGNGNCAFYDAEGEDVPLHLLALKKGETEATFYFNCTSPYENQYIDVTPSNTTYYTFEQIGPFNVTGTIVTTYLMEVAGESLTVIKKGKDNWSPAVNVTIIPAPAEGSSVTIELSSDSDNCVFIIDGSVSESYEYEATNKTSFFQFYCLEQTYSQTIVVSPSNAPDYTEETPEFIVSGTKITQNIEPAMIRRNDISTNVLEISVIPYISLADNPATFVFSSTVNDDCKFFYDAVAVNPVPVGGLLVKEDKQQVYYTCSYPTNEVQLWVTPVNQAIYTTVNTEKFVVSGITLSAVAPTVRRGLVSQQEMIVGLIPIPEGNIDLSIFSENTDCVYYDENSNLLNKNVIAYQAGADSLSFFYSCGAAMDSQTINVEAETDNDTYGVAFSASFVVTGMTLSSPDIIRKGVVSSSPLTVTLTPAAAAPEVITLSSNNDNNCVFFQKDAKTRLANNQLVVDTGDSTGSFYFMCNTQLNSQSITATPTNNQYTTETTNIFIVSGTFLSQGPDVKVGVASASSVSLSVFPVPSALGYPYETFTLSSTGNNCQFYTDANATQVIAGNTINVYAASRFYYVCSVATSSQTITVTPIHTNAFTAESFNFAVAPAVVPSPTPTPTPTPSSAVNTTSASAAKVLPQNVEDAPGPVSAATTTTTVFTAMIIAIAALLVAFLA